MRPSFLVPFLSIIASGLPCRGVPDDGSILHSGQATYYTTATGGGNCMFDPTPNNLMVGAMNDTEYDNSTVCGAFVHIVGPQGQVTVRIVDRCPECKRGDIDLSPQAFDSIAPRALGRVQIQWRYVVGAVAGPVSYRFKDGSNQWWTAVQIINAQNPVATVEYRNASGQWIALVRQQYNYFLKADGMGTGPYTIRITDIYGNQLVDTGIALSPGVIQQGAVNFPKPQQPVVVQVRRVTTDSFHSPAGVVLGRGLHSGRADITIEEVFDVRGRRLSHASRAPARAVGVFFVKD
jgi:expansin